MAVRLNLCFTLFLFSSQTNENVKTFSVEIKEILKRNYNVLSIIDINEFFG